MASSQRQVFSKERCSGPDYFDMWHDYMNLSKLLLNLRDVPEADCRESHERRAPADSPSVRKDSSSSLSSLSDYSLNGSPSDFCRFCKQNGETARVYRSHKLKSEDGKVVCPILWSYTCPICEATGDQAHTRKYCPQLMQQGAKSMHRGAHW